MYDCLAGSLHAAQAQPVQNYYSRTFTHQAQDSSSHWVCLRIHGSGDVIPRSSMQFMSAVLQAGAVIICGGLWHFVANMPTTLGKLSVFLFCTCLNIFGMNSLLWYEGKVVTQTKECMIYQIIMQKMVQNMVNLSIYSQQEWFSLNFDFSESGTSIITLLSGCQAVRQESERFHGLSRGGGTGKGPWLALVDSLMWLLDVIR